MILIDAPMLLAFAVLMTATSSLVWAVRRKP